MEDSAYLITTNKRTLYTDDMILGGSRHDPTLSSDDANSDNENAATPILNRPNEDILQKKSVINDGRIKENCENNNAILSVNNKSEHIHDDKEINANEYNMENANVVIADDADKIFAVITRLFSHVDYMALLKILGIIKARSVLSNIDRDYLLYLRICALFGLIIVTPLTLRFLENISCTITSIYKDKLSYLPSHSTRPPSSSEDVHIDCTEESIKCDYMPREPNRISTSRSDISTNVIMPSVSVVKKPNQPRSIGFLEMVLKNKSDVSLTSKVKVSIYLVCALLALPLLPIFNKSDYPSILFGAAISLQTMYPLLLKSHPAIGIYLNSLWETITDNYWPKKIRKPGALINTKETCYMNSMMQALASTTTLIKELKVIPKNDKLTMLIQFLSDIDESDDSTQILTNKLITFMNTVQWNRASQQDAFQLLSFCINAIHKEIGTKVHMPPKFKILHTFSEDSKYNKVQQHLALSVPLRGNFMEKPGADLNDLLNAFFESSSIDDGDYTTTMYLFEKAPDVMILHIQANEWSHALGAYVKPKYYIKYKDILEYEFKIQKRIDGSDVESVKVRYKLVAVVQHMGDVSGGHYVTYRMCDQRWFITNDEQVEEITFDYDIVPYIMVYEKVVL